MSKSFFSFAALALLAFANSAFASVTFLSVNFNGDTPGSVPSSNASTSWAPGNPITKPYALGGNTLTISDGPLDPTMGSILVANPPASQNATWATNTANNETGALWLDTDFSGVASNSLRLAFDLNVRSASILSGQSATLTTDSSTVHPVFGINTFSSNATLRFNAVATTATGGVYGLRLVNASTQIVPFFAYTNGASHTIALDANYTTGTVTASVDGIPQLTDYPFGAPSTGTTTVSETFFYLNGHSGDSNSIALDNVSGAIPEPASLTLLGLGAVGLLGRRRQALTIFRPKPRS